VFGIDLASIPAQVPYLTVDPPEHHPCENAKRIGIVWAGDQTRADARTKSASLADFAPLAPLVARFARAGTPVRIISLQLGPNVDELILPPSGLPIDRVLDATADIADTAAIMSTLDAIITVDTMTAHLAGALGRPVYVLAAHAPAWWLWHVDADDRSRWYPTMRIIRQPQRGDWASAMARICALLRTELDITPGPKA
jgi:hypothetical protein